MSQRRTPSGQRPARRPGQQGRGAARGARAGGQRDSAARGRSTDGSRSANRPASARRTAATGATKRTTAIEPRRFTGRATVLFAVLIALALAYTYPVRLYLNQQAEIDRIAAAQAAQRQKIGELSERAALWQNPEFVKTEAKRRFYMVEKGEQPLIVLPGSGTPDAGQPDGGPAAPAPWYDTLWSSIRAANDDGEPE
ncbi:septum formation initiator family protein [Plantactinospora sp. GCM10030261]|uniref:FtsB family cell division protein n=1 Tax=Plantactinospora sp. GCM10030261 TaxID=3273420 RepID=UPI00360B5A4D